MALQLFKIATQSLSTSASSVVFSSIPQGYTDLCIKISTRQTLTNPDSMGLKLNSSTTGNSSLWLEGEPAGVGSGTDASSVIVVSYAGIPGTAATSNTFSNIEIYIPNYAGSTAKSVSSDSVGESNGGIAVISICAGLQTSTSAITSLTLSNYSGGNFVQYSTFTLYGIL